MTSSSWLSSVVSYGEFSMPSRCMSSSAASTESIRSSRMPDSSRKPTVSCPYSARSVDDQPWYCFSSREKRCQRASVSLNCVAWRSNATIFSSLSDSRISSSSESFSM